MQRLGSRPGWKAVAWVLLLVLGNATTTWAQSPATDTATAVAPATATGEATASAPATAPIEDPKYDGGDIAWMLISTGLVLLMTAPGLALFYGGLVRKKNVLSVMMQCMFLVGMNSIFWAVIGYSLAFSNQGPTFFRVNDGGTVKEFSLIGGLDMAFLKGVSPELGSDGKPHYPPTPTIPANLTGGAATPLWGTIPNQLFMMFQMMFIIITPALICGAYAERMKFSGMALFTLLWNVLVYCPLAHWVWGPRAIFGGFSPYFAMDFAGGCVVHISSGVSALVTAIWLGKRIGQPHTPMLPHNLTMVVTGTGLLWVGWFGFNAGSAIAASAGGISSAVNAMTVTHLAAAAALLSWSFAEWVMVGKPTVLGACSGAVAGLVVITPASGFVTPMSAIVMGLIVGVICFLACSRLKQALGYDDALDAFGVHGVGGTVGALLTGLFVSKSVVGEGVIRSSQFLNQVISVGVTYALAIVGTILILTIVSATVGLRATPEDETRALDLTQHGEEGYIFQ